MFYDVVTSTDILFHLMVAVGVIGIIAKMMNLFTIRRMLGAAANMSKSTHRLIKLVRSKYEQACMLRDSVENTEAFVEKYIYEYRGNFLKVHTWRQLEKLSVWAAGVLAAVGAISWYQTAGVCEKMYQYVMLGAAEMILLFVVGQLSDEDYKLNAVKNYMIEYLENVCAGRYRCQQSEREQTELLRAQKESAADKANMNEANMNEANMNEAISEGTYTENIKGEQGANSSTEENLSIHIEGKPRVPLKEEAGQLLRKSSEKQKEADAEANLKEETIRQILEEFLA